MRWMSRQLTLPILISFSLTGVSLAVIYLWYKKDEELKEVHGKSTTGNKQNEKQIKIPRQVVPAIIGRGGSTMQDIQVKTKTKIHFEKDNIEYPDRTCVIKGDDAGIQLAEKMIKHIITNQPIIETYELYVPQKTCGRIMGRCGESLHQIQMASSAKIIVDSSYISRDPNAERRIIIKGTAEQIANALSQIEDKVREEKEARLKLEASTATRLPRGKLSPRNTAVNNTDHTQSTESLPPQFTEGVMEVYVSAMETPSQFWVQVVGPGTTALDKLVSEMTVYYSNEENREIHALRNISIGQVVAAKFSFDEQWYRAEVISTAEDGYCEVYFVDYGDRETVDVNAILELRTDFLSLRLQAVECSLANVKARDNEWSTEACDKFAELTWLAQWKVLVAKVRGYKERALGYGRSRREGSPIPCVELHDKNDDKDINIALELVNEGFAEAEEAFPSAASSTLSLSTRSHDFLAVSTPVPASPHAEGVAAPGKSDAPPATPKTPPARPEIEEIDLTTPQRRIEEIDLVTPVKDETERFVASERRAYRENGGGDCLRNGNAAQYKNPTDYGNSRNGRNIPPAGYESDRSDDSDVFELG